METSYDFIVQAEDDSSYHILKTIYKFLPNAKSWLCRDEERQFEGGGHGGIYELIDDIRSIRYILSKYSVSGVAFSARATEDRNAGYMGLSKFSYENNNAKMCEIGYCVYNDDVEDCSELTFAITGKLKYFSNREELAEYIVDELDGRVTDGISRNTDYLINNDPESMSSKNQKAKDLGITVISEKEFLWRFGNPEYNDEQEALIEEFEQDQQRQAEEFLNDMLENPISDGRFSTEIWEIKPFDPASVDRLDKDLRSAFTNTGISIV